MATLFKRAVKRDAKLRLALCGPAGSGKTFTALTLAVGIAGPGGRVALVDTERGSAAKYGHTDMCGGDGVCSLPDHFTFDSTEPDDYAPAGLIAAIKDAAAQGYSVLVADSLSHYWMGKGGELEMVDVAAKRTQGNSFAAWKHVTPVHNELVDTMLSAKIHVIVTMRTKTEWVIEDVNGKKVPRKLGLAPIMRDGVEFEFDVCGDLDQDNTLVITKSRCYALAGKVIQRPGIAVAASLTEWLRGAPATSTAPLVASAPARNVDIAEVLVSGIRPWNNFKSMLKCFEDVRVRLGDTSYYAILGQFGHKHSNEFRDAKKALDCYNAMMFKATADPV